jgi:hypothetical protein
MQKARLYVMTKGRKGQTRLYRGIGRLEKRVLATSRCLTARLASRR